jgi:glutaredoxin
MSFAKAALAVLALAAFAGAAGAQQVYRIVGPDGKVTFSDRPPSEGKAAPAQAVAIGGGGGSPVSSLPIELRRAAGQYPVSLYTTNSCGPCESARSYLRQRGIPYSEYTVSTREDFAALQRVSGTSSLPFMTLGAQHIPGFSEAEWSQYFDAAGYPRASQLPSGYRNADPQPLVAVQRVAPPPRTAQQQQPQRAEANPASELPVENPAGIRF